MLDGMINAQQLCVLDPNLEPVLASGDTVNCVPELVDNALWAQSVKRRIAEVTLCSQVLGHYVYGGRGYEAQRMEPKVCLLG